MNELFVGRKRGDPDDSQISDPTTNISNGEKEINVSGVPGDAHDEEEINQSLMPGDVNDEEEINTSIVVTASEIGENEYYFPPYLPEECVMKIISFTSAGDAATSIPLVSKMFKSIADSDHVWQNFIPVDYNEFIPEELSTALSKKELFIHLCRNPVLSHDALRLFALEKRTGKKCYMLGGRLIDIRWSYHKDYWWWNAESGSRFPEVAQLLQVWWFYIWLNMETKLLSRKTIYEAYLVLKLNEAGSGGFHMPVDVQVEMQTGYKQKGKIPWILEDRGDDTNHWKEMKIGEFYNNNGDEGLVELSFLEGGPNTRKFGLFLQGIEFRPKNTTTPFL